jgi:hypothetical protein
MNNEPVAWINVEKRRLEWDKPTLWETPTVVKLDRIPLYTHPVKELTDDPLANFKPVWQEVPAIKELTDEEIQTCMGCLPKYNSEIVDEDLVKFARAILRKAQEK